MQEDSWCPLQSVLCWERHACFFRCCYKAALKLPYLPFSSWKFWFTSGIIFIYQTEKNPAKTLNEINWNFWHWHSHAACSLQPAIWTQTFYLFCCENGPNLKFCTGFTCHKSELAAASLFSSLELCDCSILRGAGHPKEVEGVLISCVMTLHPLKWMKCQPLTCSRVWAGVLPGLLRSSLIEIFL